MNNTIAIYRIHYGIDFIDASIRSIEKDVDEIHIWVSKEPWVKTDTIRYFGKNIPFPENPENVIDYLNKKFQTRPEVKIRFNEFSTPKNQFGILAKQSVKWRRQGIKLLFMEPDMIFPAGVLAKAKQELQNLPITFQQIEFWKNLDWRVPFRSNRFGPTLHYYQPETEIITGFGTYGGEHCLAKQPIWNLGFCVNSNTMLYKHLLAITFSRKIGDSIPAEDWFETKWLNWTPETTDLEISAKHRHHIPKIQPFDCPNELMELLKIER